MFHLYRYIFFSAIGALSSPFLQKVFSNLVSKKFTLLVFDSRYLGVLHLLRIKTNSFDRAKRNRGESLNPFCPCCNIENTRRKRRGQPPLLATSVKKAGLPVPCMPVASRAPYSSSPKKSVFNTLTPMLKVNSDYDLSPVFSMNHKSNTCRFAPWINLEFQRLGFPVLTVFEDDRERITAKNRGPLTF
jgi:hypothetical protein